MRMQLVMDPPSLTAADPVAEGGTTPDTPSLRPWHAVLVVEEVWTGDGRFCVEGCWTWRDLPLPFMGIDRTTYGHDDALAVGRIDVIERQGTVIHAWGVWDNSPEADHFYDLVTKGIMRGVSVDPDDVESELLLPASWFDVPIDDDGDGTDDHIDDYERDPETGDVVIQAESPRERYLSARIMGATLCPFPAFMESYVENDVAAPEAIEAVAASAGVTGFVVSMGLPSHSLPTAATAAAPVVAPERVRRTFAPDPPVTPPFDWFANPHLRELSPMTVTDEGRVFGHFAGWDSCHIGFADRCVTPPRSMTGYAHFLTGELVCDDGSRVPVGQLTMDTGHAPLSATAAHAVAHYDDTGTAVADVFCGEDEYGIWFAGGLRPGLDAARIRAFMASELSGDWRRIGRGLEFIAALAVNVPGFHKPRVRTYQSNGIIAALTASLPVIDRPTPRYVNPATAELIAASIGRDAMSRRRELHAIVHGGR